MEQTAMAAAKAGNDFHKFTDWNVAWNPAISERSND
jgi:hypothetical protein